MVSSLFSLGSIFLPQDASLLHASLRVFRPLQALDVVKFRKGGPPEAA
jgi:hypothetical protein